MTSRDFCYWLQGLFELGKIQTLDEEQVACIRRHLNMVFHHEIDPSMGDERHLQELRDLHTDLQGGSVDLHTPGFLRPGSVRINC